MFNKFAKSGLVDFSVAGFRKLRRANPRQGGLFSQTPANDNFPALRGPKGRRRFASPALACHWLDRHGRLECRWQAEAGGDALVADVDGPARRARRRAFT